MKRNIRIFCKWFRWSFWCLIHHGEWDCGYCPRCGGCGEYLCGCMGNCDKGFLCKYPDVENESEIL